MAKFDQREGNSCHIHMSLRGDDGEHRVRRRGRRRPPMFESFVAGIQATMRELTLLYAPNINSYKRFQPGSFAPTATAWGYDNRTCSLRVVGHGAGLRLENRLPGGDVNPYLAHGRHARQRPARHRARARARSRPSRATPTPPTTRGSRRRCSEARDLFAGFRRGPRAASATQSSTTTRTAPTWSSLPSVPPSPTGSDSADSRGCERGDMRSHLVDRSGDRAGGRHRRADVGRADRCRDREVAARRSTVAQRRPGRPRTPAAAVRRRRRRSTSRSWPSWRCATPATRSPTRGGRPATYATCSTTTPPRRNACSAGRSRSPAAST